jgi:hypothetical protein
LDVKALTLHRLYSDGANAGSLVRLSQDNQPQDQPDIIVWTCLIGTKSV